jgi:hypothetical protein
MAARVYRHRHPGSMIPLALQTFRMESRQRQSALAPAVDADNTSLRLSAYRIVKVYREEKALLCTLEGVGDPYPLSRLSRGWGQGRARLKSCHS